MSSATPTGDSYGFVQDGHRSLEAAAEAARETHEHLWIVLATFRLSDAEVERARSGSTALLGGGNLLDVSEAGCYVCEAAYGSARGKPCKGNPVRYTPTGAPVYAGGSVGYS